MHLDESAIAIEQDRKWIRPRNAVEATAVALTALSRVARARSVHGVKPFSPGSNYANAFCCLLLSGSTPNCLKMIVKLEAQGLCYETLVDKVFAPAARNLGQKWSDNDLSFFEVWTGISTLFLVNATLRSQTAPVAAGSRKHVLFVTLPHQAHNLGIILAAEAFRRRRWEVDMMLNAANDRVIDYVSESQVGLIGMTAGREDNLDAIFSLCAGLSKLPRPPVVLVGGAAAQTGQRRYPAACIRVDNVEDALRRAECMVRS